MQSKILASKKIIKNNKGETFVDLTTRSLDYRSGGQVIDAFYVGEDMAMRLDLVSFAAYGNDDHFDIIAKYNGISNPYSLDINDLIYIPDLGFMYDSLYNPQNKNDVEEVRNKFIDPKKITTLDPKKILYDEELKQLRKNINGGSFSNYNLPPNFAEPGDSEATLTKNGNFILGNNIIKK